MLEIILTMAFCLASTILIEGVLARIIFKIRDANSLMIVVAAQLLTNPIVVGICSVLIPSILVSYGLGTETEQMMIWWLSTGLFEVAAFIVEGFVYSNSGFDKPYAMSLVLNIFSFGIGLVFSAIWGIFVL